LLLRIPLIVSLSTGTGEHCSVGSTGSSILPNRILVGKHSRITAKIIKINYLITKGRFSHYDARIMTEQNLVLRKQKSRNQSSEPPGINKLLQFFQAFDMLSGTVKMPP
jgi:hypothetical protein